jgi:hypothetical protein
MTTDAAPRSPTSMATVLREDTLDWRYRYLWCPLLVLQAVLYTRVVLRFLHRVEYPAMPTAEHPLLRENHIGNLVSLRSPIHPWLLGIHVAMAWLWIAGTLGQKHLVRRMAGAIARPGDRWRAYRTVHAALGMALLALGFAGILVAPVIALLHHGNPPMKWFLVSQLVTFLPPMTMVAVTARSRTRSLRDHRFWAEFAFVGPAVASVWTEGAIYVTGRFTALGPNRGELWSSVVGGALGFALVVLPAWSSWRRGLAADAA